MEKSIARLVIASLFLSVSSVGHAGAVWAEVQRSLRMYDSVSASEIVWGQEQGRLELGAVIEPPLFTGTSGNGDVEVIEFVRYPQDVWRRAETLSGVWRKSLPAGVVVRRVPMDLQAGEFGQRGNWAQVLREQQRVYFASEVLGIEETVHEVLMSGGERGDKSIRKTVEEIGGLKGVDQQVFDALRKHEVMRARSAEASGLISIAWEAYAAAGHRGEVPWLFPELIVNGRYAVSASRVGDPAETYRIANALIRRELERDQGPAGPSHDEEFGQWMANRGGVLLRQVVFGRELELAHVYSPARDEMWGVSQSGKYVGTYKREGAGRQSYYRHQGRTKTKYWSYWRFGRLLRVYNNAEGVPQKYGAFLLMDFLCAPDTHWVQLRFRGRKTAMAFDQCEHGEGRVEGRNANGAVFGSWWLEAGELKVAFASEVGSESWPWREVAKQVGWEVPRESLTPWRFRDGESEDKVQTVARGASGDR